MDKSTVYDCNIIQLPRIKNAAVSITSITAFDAIPFDIQRVYCLYDIPAGAVWGGHAHKELETVIIAGSGSFDVMLDDGKIRRYISLNNPNYGLCIKSGIWRELANFSSGAVVIAIASILFSEDDYIRNYREFTKYKKAA